MAKQKYKYATRETVLNADDLKIVELDVDEWELRVRVRGLMGEQRDDYLGSLLVNPGVSDKLKLQNATAKLVSKCMVDSDGQQMFTEKDVHLLGKKNGQALDRVYNLASELSGLRPEDIEKITQNLGSGQNGDSTSS